MKYYPRRKLSLVAILVFVSFGVATFYLVEEAPNSVTAQTKPSPTPSFDQKAVLAKLKEDIKGKEMLPAGEVFKNVKNFAQFPAGRLLAIMEFGYSRSLGVDCTHCHTPENWASEDKPTKQIAREMQVMSNKINQEILPTFKAFEGREGRNRPLINCTTCHRGEVKPATNLRPVKKSG